MKRGSGFTLLELIMVVIIIGVLAGLAIPQYINAVERAKAGKAISGMGLIRQAENLYRADNDTYVEVDDGSMNADLGAYVELVALDADPDWEYSVSDADESTMIIHAIREAGPFEASGDDEIQMNETGALDTSGWGLP